MLPIAGFRELWGHSIFQCPYCHGFEVQDEPWGYLVLPHRLEHLVPFSTMARGWTKTLTVFTNGGVDVPDEARAKLTDAGIRLETARITELTAREGALTEVALEGGGRVPCTALFVHPLQRQVALVQSLGVSLDQDGFVAVDAMRRETSVPGIYAAGDLATKMQGAVLAAASGTHAASAINMELTMDLVARGALS
jgi:thioredoxin reductase